jgi:hypothetical protein
MLPPTNTDAILRRLLAQDARDPPAALWGRQGLSGRSSYLVQLQYSLGVAGILYAGSPRSVVSGLAACRSSTHAYDGYPHIAAGVLASARASRILLVASGPFVREQLLSQADQARLAHDRRPKNRRWQWRAPRWERSPTRPARA